MTCDIAAGLGATLSWQTGLQDSPSLIFKYRRGKKASNKFDVTMNSRVKRRMVL